MRFVKMYYLIVQQILFSVNLISLKFIKILFWIRVHDFKRPIMLARGKFSSVIIYKCKKHLINHGAFKTKKYENCDTKRL